MRGSYAGGQYTPEKGNERGKMDEGGDVERKKGEDGKDGEGGEHREDGEGGESGESGEEIGMEGGGETKWEALIGALVGVDMYKIDIH